MNVKNYRKNDSNLLLEQGIDEKLIAKFHRLFNQSPYLSNVEISITQDKNDIYLIEITISSYHIRLYHFEITPDLNLGFEKCIDSLIAQMAVWKKNRFAKAVRIGA